MDEVLDRIQGVVVGIFIGFDGDCPLVVYPGNPEEAALPARSLAEITSDMVGAEVALLFEEGNPRRPLIVGRIVDTARKSSRLSVVRSGESITIIGDERIEMRCGKATIIMEKDGHITIRGTYLVSHASASNRIRGGSVNLN
ncbi:hypothetical protein BFX40_28655 [Mesorhizobium sp. SEMIA 3007]|uniref:DUF6484 domain-containing protein n=1 Tax=Mesorhizobium sp. SEMIA 3007 TaxID=1862350 RepID=UPI00083D3D80|nr:DUF6484 domain-containing protein [Mesorhizobium sp. SEMIA 3007]ODA96440.1 hypothetical protein BFX40_28655 [Mesorhizobium sp. SEMIA 3007]